MSERYIVTGVQLALLVELNDYKKRKDMMNDIIDKQFVGNSSMNEDEKKKEFGRLGKVYHNACMNDSLEQYLGKDHPVFKKEKID